jgi:flagellin
MSRINTNISSMQAMNYLAKNQSDLSTSMQRLSSGLRINAAKDDPAGLIASENLRAEMTSINSAIENSERANNVISTAEGALNEVSALLLEIRGLVTTSANTGALATEEIDANQLQIDSILESIDRIANSTQFNGKKLLDGSLEYNLESVDNSQLESVRLHSANIPETGTLPIVVEVKASAELGQVIFSGAAIAAGETVSFRVAGNEGSEVFSFIAGTSIADIATSINGFSDGLGVSAIVSGAILSFNSANYGTDAFVKVESIGTDDFLTRTATGTGATSTTDYGVDADVSINGQQATTSGLQVSLRNNSIDLEVLLSSDLATMAGGISTSTFDITGGGATFQIGSNVDANGQASLGIYSASTGTLGNNNVGRLSSLRSGGNNSVLTDNLINAERIVDSAITQISTERGRLGAFQKNVIDTNINSLEVALENVTASESSIRDADFAEETSNMTRSQILVQATTTVLKTANSNPQNVLSLLG